MAVSAQVACASAPPVESGRLFIVAREGYFAQASTASTTQLSVAEESCDSGTLVSLAHPRIAGLRVYYLLRGAQMLEINAHVPYKDRASWFVGEHVHSDGRLYLATPMDPLFLLLPALEQQRGKTSEHTGLFCRRDQLLMALPELDALFRQSLLHIDDIRLDAICDRKPGSPDGDESLWRLSDERVLAWLSAKVDRIVARLADASLSANVTALSAGAVDGFQAGTNARKRKRDGSDSSQHLFAIDLLVDYVAEHWLVRLREHYGIIELDQPEPKRKSAPAAAPELASASPAGTQRGPDGSTPIDDYTKLKTSAAITTTDTPKLTGAQKQLAKSASMKGVTKLTSFFAKPPADSSAK